MDVIEKKKKTGPKGSYAVRKLINKLNDEEKSKIRKRYYAERASKKDISNEVDISPQLVGKLLKELGPLKASDLSF